MAWWLLLYVLSMVSRYQPAKWIKLLDLDKSKYAVPLQYALQEAISALPHLVLEALDNRSWLLPKPMMMFDW
jgi:YaaC-like Protein